jgi:tetratricopeptide (TPR) repeat protein
MVAGVRPFAGASTMDVIVSINRDAPPPPSTHDDRIPAELDRLVMRCLEKKPADRPDMGEVAHELAAPGLALPSRRRAPRRARLLQGAAAVVVLLGCVGGLVARRRSDSQGPRHPTVTADSPPVTPPVPTTLLDLPTPSSQVPEALATYRSALQDERDGAVDSALIKLDQATKLDPSLASAHLNLAIQLASLEADSARAHFAQATKLPDRLTPREREIVEAYRPLFQRDPPDLDDWERRVTALAVRYPNDAEIWMDVGSMQFALGAFQRSIASFQRALAIDPRYGFATTELGQEQAYIGDFTGARATVARCLQGSPNASWCMWIREAIDGKEGNCQPNEASARERIAADPTIPDGYKALYFALAAQGRPASLVREAIEQTVKRIADPRDSARLRAALGARLDALEGDFEAAAREASDLRAIIAKDSDVAAHANAATLSVEIELEAGRTDSAARIASAFLGRRDVWAAGPIPHDYPLSHDTTPFLLSVAFHDGHAMTRPAYEAALSTWRVTWDKALRGGYRQYLWVYGYAPTVRSADEAVEAVAALGSYLPIPPFLPNGRIPPIDIGHTLVLGGREEEGISYLRAGTSSCDAGVSPILLFRGHAWLADALAGRGDVAGACAEYATVLGRWGHAKPRSVTADHARARRQALGCDAR